MENSSRKNKPIPNMQQIAVKRFWVDNLYLNNQGSRIIRYKGAVYCKKIAFAEVVNFVANTKVPTKKA
jgi:hypothetical protein